MNPVKISLLAGALYGVTGVVLGAWGAHGLEAFLGGGDTGPWETAVQYQLTHALALLLLGVLLHLNADPAMIWSSRLVILGVLLFSGSIYLLTLGGPRWLGPVTPLGGSALIAGWLALAIGAWRWR